MARNLGRAARSATRFVAGFDDILSRGTRNGNRVRRVSSGRQAKGNVMPDLHRDQPRNPLQRLERPDEPNTMLGILSGGIVCLFIAGIIGAFIYAKDTNPVTAQAPSAPAAAAP